MPSEPAGRLKTLRADLHVHTVLSPCAEIEMLPPLIVGEALERGIDWIAITDHNASGNIAAVQRAAQGTGLTVMPGMELQTREEVHVLCLFDELDQVGALQAWVDAHLPDLRNRPDFFGDQLLVDEAGDFLAREERLLLTSASVSIDEAAGQVARLGGLLVPAHINRRANGLIETLGFVPAGVPIEGLEISRHITPAEATRRYPQIQGYPLLQNGDVHRLEDFLGVNRLTVAQPSIAELRLALKGCDGRAVEMVAG